MTTRNEISAAHSMLVKAAHLVMRTILEPLPIARPILVTTPIHSSPLTRHPQQARIPERKRLLRSKNHHCSTRRNFSDTKSNTRNSLTGSVALQLRPAAVNTAISITTRSPLVMEKSSRPRLPHYERPSIFATIVFDSLETESTRTTSQKLTAERSASASKWAVECLTAPTTFPT